LDLTRVPVIRRTDLSDAEKKASRIADNKTAESEWLDDELETEVDLLAQEPEIEIDNLGFDDDEIDDLIGELQVPEFDPISEEEQPSLDETEPTVCPECGNEWHE
jgi:ParB-like chromosome segregation protein Spo0J